MLAPVVLFVYNRPWHTEQTLLALEKNELAKESVLYIYSDGPKTYADEEEFTKIQEVRRIIKLKKWCKEVIIVESDVNKGLARSVISGVSEVINIYGKIIVMEDDLIVNHFFLKFMNHSLETYINNHKIFSIGATTYNFKIPKSYKDDIYILRRSESWGWATWDDRWNSCDWFNFPYNDFLSDKTNTQKFNRLGKDLTPMLQANYDGKIDSWAILWDAFHFINNAYCIRPIKSLVTNIGFDNSGTHCQSVNSIDNVYNGVMYEKNEYEFILPVNLKHNKKIERNFVSIFQKNNNLNEHLYFLYEKFKKHIIKLRKKIVFGTLSLYQPHSNVFGLNRGKSIDRLYIENFLENNSRFIRNRVLEISEDTYTKMFGKDVFKSDILHVNNSNPHATIVGDLTNLDLSFENQFDCFICTQTLNFIYDFRSAVIGCHKLLSENGTFLGTVSGISQISRYDMDKWGDYWRFTDLSVLKLFEEVFGVGNVKINIYGNALAATAFIQGMAQEEILYNDLLMKSDPNYQIIIGIRAVKKS